MSAESADDETVTNVQFQLSLHCVAMTGIWPYQELPDTGSYAGRQFIHVGLGCNVVSCTHGSLARKLD